jgi:hypothetical protein
MDVVTSLVSFFKVAFPNRKSVFFIGLLVALCAVLFQWARLLTISELFSSFFVVVLFIAVLVFVCIEYYNHVAFYYKKYILAREGVKFCEGLTRVHIVCSDYEVKPLMKSYKVDIKGAGYDMQCKFLVTEELLIIYLRKNAIGGLYQREIGSVIFDIKSISKINEANAFTSNLPNSFLISDSGEHLWVSFKTPFVGVNKILVYDYQRILTKGASERSSWWSHANDP